MSPNGSKSRISAPPADNLVCPATRRCLCPTPTAPPPGPPNDETSKLNLDEVDEVLSELRQLWHRVTSPVIRECLEAVRTDIAYLASTGDEYDQEDDLEAEDLDDLSDEELREDEEPEAEAA